MTTGAYTDGTHELLAAEHEPILKVRDVKRNVLVAYSNGRADYDQSVEEFVHDFFGLGIGEVEE
jgi:hypothetical protein